MNKGVVGSMGGISKQTSSFGLLSLLSRIIEMLFANYLSEAYLSYPMAYVSLAKWGYVAIDPTHFCQIWNVPN